MWVARRVARSFRVPACRYQLPLHRTAHLQALMRLRPSISSCT